MRRALPFSIVLVSLFVLVPTALAATIYGTRGDDTLTGTDRRDHIYGLAGNDSLIGKDGSDFLHGNRGNDDLSGDDGADYLFGGPGNDSLDGDDGPDWIWTGDGIDVVEAGAQNDHVRAGADDGDVDVIDCGAGFDRAVVRTGDVAIDCERVRVLAGHRPPTPGSVQRGTRGDDTLTGTEGRDWLFGFRGNDTLNGLGGSDFLFGGADNDTVNGDDGVDYGWGGSGNDTVNGGNHADWLYAGRGADSVNGGDGNDHLFAAADDGQHDSLDCGPGERDRALIRPGDTAVNCERVRSVTS